ncbi:MAG: hypothetical protein AAGE98_19360 [Actinomycetota bacterium]
MAAMVDPDEAVTIGRSILVGVALDQLRLRSRPIVTLLAVVSVAGLIAAVLFDDVLRVVAIAVLVLSLSALVVVIVARFLAGRVLKAIAPPAEVSDHRDAIQDAIDQLALPTGPISGLKFAWGLRDGIDDELANANDVITTLGERLDV